MANFPKKTRTRKTIRGYLGGLKKKYYDRPIRRLRNLRRRPTRKPGSRGRQTLPRNLRGENRRFAEQWLKN